MRRKSRGLVAALVMLLPAWVAAQGSYAPAQVERGRVLMNGIVACGNCHVARGPQGQPLFERGLSGGMVFDEPPFRAVASNLTPDAATGIGRWTDAQLVKAIREGIRPDGSVIGPPMPIEFYRHLSDDDTMALIAFMRSQPAVANAVGKSVYRMPLPPAYGLPLGTVTAPPANDRLRYGEYLATIGHCMDCHTPRAADGRLVAAKWGAGGQRFPGPWGLAVSRNLTPDASGLKDWSDAEIARAIRDGMRKDGTPLKPPMGYGFYKTMSDADMAALIGYLRSLKAQPFGG
jgi:mono/diheme cytochrome c family protein